MLENYLDRTKAKQIIDLFMVEGEVVLQNVIINLIKLGLTPLVRRQMKEKCGSDNSLKVKYIESEIMPRSMRKYSIRSLSSL